MAMLSANSALVAGSVAAGDAMNVKVQVVRPFWSGGKPHQADAVIEVSEFSALELIAMGKAKKYDPPSPKAKPAPVRVDPPKEAT